MRCRQCCTGLVPTVGGLACLCDPAMHTKKVIANRLTARVAKERAYWLNQSSSIKVAAAYHSSACCRSGQHPSGRCACCPSTNMLTACAISQQHCILKQVWRHGTATPDSKSTLKWFSLTPMIVWHGVATELQTHLRTSTGKCASARPETICCRVAAVHWR